MATPRSGQRADATLDRRLRALEDGQRQLRERFARPQQIPKAAAGGGIVDIAGFNTSGVAGLPWASGQYQMNFGAVTYGTPFSMVDDSVPSWLTISGSQIYPTEDGFYEALCLARLVWHTLADSPTSLSLFVNGRNPPSSPTHAVVARGSTYGVEQPATNGPEWMTTSDYWQLEADGIAATSADIYLSGAVWRITKYGSA